MSGLYPGSVDLVQRVPVGKQDHRDGATYAAALARETEASLRHSPRWRAGLPLSEDERWPNLSSDQLGSRSGIPPHGGRWPR